MTGSWRKEAPAPTQADADAAKDVARIRFIERENMWRNMVEKELRDRLRRQELAADREAQSASPSTAELIAAVRDVRLRERVAAEPELRETLRALRARVKSMDDCAPSDAAYQFLNSNHLASNFHMFNKERRKKVVLTADSHKGDNTSLWCASWELARR